MVAWWLVRGRGSAYLPWMTEVMSARSCLSTVVHTLVMVRVRVRCRGRARVRVRGRGRGEVEGRARVRVGVRGGVRSTVVQTLETHGQVVSTVVTPLDSLTHLLTYLGDPRAGGD